MCCCGCSRLSQLWSFINLSFSVSTIRHNKHIIIDSLYCTDIIYYSSAYKGFWPFPICDLYLSKLSYYLIVLIYSTPVLRKALTRNSVPNLQQLQLSYVACILLSTVIPHKCHLLFSFVFAQWIYLAQVHSFNSPEITHENPEET